MFCSDTLPLTVEQQNSLLNTKALINNIEAFSYLKDVRSDFKVHKEKKEN